MSTRRRITAAVVVATALLAGVIGCGGSRSSSTQKVTVVLDWTPNTNHTGVYLAKQQGVYTTAGLNVDIIEPDQAGGLAQVAAGNAQFAFSYAEQVLPVRAQGTPIVSIATVLRTNTSSLVSPVDRKITRPRDLAGKTYGTFGGPIEEPLIKALVACDGGDPTTVAFVDVGNADYNVGFRKKAYDAVWVFDGWDVIRLRELEAMAVTTIPFYGVGPASCLPDWYTPLVATSQQLIDEDPDLVRAFMKATAAGYEAARTDPEAAAGALLAAAPELDADLVTRSAVYLSSRYGDPGQPWGVQRPDTWSDFAAFLVKNALLSPKVDAAAAFTNDFLPKATTS